MACRALGAEDDGFVSYGKFRNFLVLLPEAKLVEVDPSIAWFEAATMVPFGEEAACGPLIHECMKGLWNFWGIFCCQESPLGLLFSASRKLISSSAAPTNMMMQVL